MYKTANVTHATYPTAQIKFTLFEDSGDVGITASGEARSARADIFPEESFLAALWELYPEGLPKILTRKEKIIREITLEILRHEGIRNRDYDDMLQTYNVSTPAARLTAEMIYAMTEKEND